MADEQLLTAEEIKTLRERTERARYQWKDHFKMRVVATLEALMAENEEGA